MKQAASASNEGTKDFMKTKRKSHASGNGKHDAGHQPSRGYPRPQLERGEWINLNGPWEFAIDAAAEWRGPRQFRSQQTIEVPFAPETPLSGVENTGFFDAVW